MLQNLCLYTCTVIQRWRNWFPFFCPTFGTLSSASIKMCQNQNLCPSLTHTCWIWDTLCSQFGATCLVGRLRSHLQCIRAHGITVNCPFSECKGVALHDICLLLSLLGVSCEPGEVVFGCVLDWDFDKKLVLVSLNPELVGKRKAVENHPEKQKKVDS